MEAIMLETTISESEVGERKTRMKKRMSWTPYLFIAPWILGFLLFTVGPLLFSLYISFFDWPLIGAPKFIGLENFRYMMMDDYDFWDAFRVTSHFAALYVPFTLVLALLLALLLNRPSRAQGFFRTLFYLPSIISSVALVGVFASMYHTQYGVLNYLLSLVGIAPIDWLGSPDWAIWSILFATLWSVGGTMLVFLVGLKNIPRDLYDAAALSGASKLKQFFYITLPILSPVILFNVVTTLIGAFQQLSLVLLLTKGGPVNSTQFLAMYIYNTAFRYFDMGYASAMSWVLFLLILILTLCIMRFTRKWMYYEAETPFSKSPSKKKSKRGAR
jgi:multiple sugar transport system permease protein